MSSLSPLPGGAYSWRPARPGHLRAAADHHLAAAERLAREATCHLLDLVEVLGIDREQRRRLRSLAACSELAAQGARRLLDELAPP